MLLSFSVENYLSFKNKVVLDLQAGSIKEYTENIYTSLFSGGHSTLKSVGVFGHNSGGKTNVIKAMRFMRDFVSNSAMSKEISVEPFRLASTQEIKPSTFEIIFLLDKKKYRYGFSVTNKYVDSEWLFVTEKRKEENMFVRARQNFSFEKSFKATLKGKFELINEMIRTTTLFLSVLAQYNFTLFLDISNWFSKIIIAQDIEHIALVDFTAKLMATGDYRKLINDVIKKSDLGIDSVESRLKEAASIKDYSYEFLHSVFENDFKQYNVQTGHIIYNQDNIAVGKIYFDLLRNESLGTQKFFGILGPLLYTIKERGIIFIDEIDARMHSVLLADVIGLFNSKKTNPNGAQLIFTTHNTNVLKKGLRRDQMVFVEKDMYGVSSLQSLYSKDPKVRNDASFDKDYLSGKYGAIPGLGSQLDLFDSL
jgi:uncharacterized protein